jgi:hypothetical protein
MSVSMQTVFAADDDNNNNNNNFFIIINNQIANYRYRTKKTRIKDKK